MSQNSLTANELDRLFREAAASEPDLTSSNFTKMVMNRLPAKVSRAPLRRWLPDAVGFFVAVFAIWMMTDPVKLLSSLPAEFPASFVISLPNVLFLSGAMVVTSLIGWYIVERDF